MTPTEHSSLNKRDAMIEEIKEKKKENTNDYDYSMSENECTYNTKDKTREHNKLLEEKKSLVIHHPYPISVKETDKRTNEQTNKQTNKPNKQISSRV
tara:strand:+ start:2617 stop:2907 length:291 start_codon:yes stop_codon:yes gene_type:complete